VREWRCRRRRGTERNAYEWGPEFGFRWRNFLLQGEYIQIGVDRSVTNTVENPHLYFTGGYVEGSWTLTGEPRLYKVLPPTEARDCPAAMLRAMLMMLGRSMNGMSSSLVESDKVSEGR
jgi:Phosphate-selective porin O and P